MGRYFRQHPLYLLSCNFFFVMQVPLSIHSLVELPTQQSVDIAMSRIASFFIDLCYYRIWELFPLGCPLDDLGHYILGDHWAGALG